LFRNTCDYGIQGNITCSEMQLRACGKYNTATVGKKAVNVYEVIKFDLQNNYASNRLLNERSCTVVINPASYLLRPPFDSRPGNGLS
jgi:hypothetical protein